MSSTYYWNVDQDESGRHVIVFGEMGPNYTRKNILLRASVDEVFSSLTRKEIREQIKELERSPWLEKWHGKPPVLSILRGEDVLEITI